MPVLLNTMVLEAVCCNNTMSYVVLVLFFYEEMMKYGDF